MAYTAVSTRNKAVQQRLRGAGRTAVARVTIAGLVLGSLLLAATGAASAQGSLAVSTDKAAYAEGEMISVTVRIDNDSGEFFSLMGSSSCQAGFRLETGGATILDLQGQPCTADEVFIDFRPGSWREWTWTLDTVALGIPETSGQHDVIGFYPGTQMADTTTISADAFVGGHVSVQVLSGVTDDQLATVFDSLNVEVLSSRERSDGRTETWQIRGTPVDEAVATYANDPRFGFFEREFVWLSFVSVDTEDAPELPRTATQLSVYPNPCRAHCRVVLVGGSPGPRQMDLYDVLGRRLRAVSMTGGEAAIDAQALGGGLYFLTVRDGSRLVTGRLLVGH